MVYRRLPAPARRAIRAIHFELARMRSERWYTDIADRRRFLNHAFQFIAFNEITGDYAEFGCWSAMTFQLAYHATRRANVNCMLWAFDSFAGLPESTDPRDAHPKWLPQACSMSIEDFHRVLAERGVPRSAYRVVAGYYEQTLLHAAAGLPGDIALAYIDCDMYSSTHAVLRFLEPRLKHGMILALDDYFCYSASRPSCEKLALEQFFAKHQEWRLAPYIQYGWHGMSFILERQ
jgi:hypothetical protein